MNETGMFLSSPAQHLLDSVQVVAGSNRIQFGGQALNVGNETRLILRCSGHVADLNRPVNSILTDGSEVRQVRWPKRTDGCCSLDHRTGYVMTIDVMHLTSVIRPQVVNHSRTDTKCPPALVGSMAG